MGGFPKSIIFLGFLAGEIHAAGIDWKQACPEQPKALGYHGFLVAL